MKQNWLQLLHSLFLMMMMMYLTVKRFLCCMYYCNKALLWMVGELEYFVLL
jgi:hypothetical protein